MSEELEQSMARIKMYIAALEQMEASIDEVREAACGSSDSPAIMEARIAGYRSKLAEVGHRLAREACAENKRAMGSRPLAFGRQPPEHEVSQLLELSQIEQELADAIRGLAAAVSGECGAGSNWIEECEW